jgi:SPP1 gp7 family putative phage head morphogenesis protein
MSQAKKVKKRFSNKAFLRDSNDLHNTLRLTVATEKTISEIFKEINTELVKAAKTFINTTTKEDLQLLESIEENQTKADALAFIRQFTKNMNQIGKNLDDRFKQIVKDVTAQSFRSGAITAQQQVNIVTPQPQPTRFVLTPKDKRIIKMLRETDFSLVKTLTTRHIAESRAIMVQGLQDGLSQKAIIEEMMNRLRQSEFNARRIIRTEITRTANIAARARYLEAGITTWQWNTAIDERVCVTCAPLHGVSVKIGEPFNPFMTEQGKQNIRHLLPHKVSQPPAHPFCRCGVSVSFTKTSSKRKTIEKVKKAEIDIQGYTKSKENVLRKFLKVIPNQVKKQVKLLNGSVPIKKVKGRLVDDPEVQQLVSPAILNKHRTATGYYLGGKINRAFLAKGTGSNEALHEVGHGIYDEYIKPKGKMREKWIDIHNQHLRTGDFVTIRSSLRPEEHFADSIRIYLIKPMILKLKYPEIYDYIQKNVMLGNETGSIVTLEKGFMYKRKNGVWKKYEV